MQEMTSSGTAPPSEDPTMEIHDVRWLDAVLGWASTHPDRVLGLVTLFACLEGLFLVGLFVSSVFLVTVASAATIQGGSPIVAVVLCAFLGALLGDSLGYALGRGASGAGQGRFPIAKLPGRFLRGLERAEKTLVRMGGGAVMLGRFLPPIRSVVPFAVGLAGMSARRYFAFEVVACALWSVCLGLIVSGVGWVF
jgi:undecaprenyl-diphosphatase